MRTVTTSDRTSSRPVECPVCRRDMFGVSHTVGFGPTARPCGCRVAYRIAGRRVQVETP